MLSPCFAQASPEEGLREVVAKIDGAASSDVGRVEEALIQEFGVKREDLQPLLEEKLSYGNIAVLLATAASSGKERQEVLNLLKRGKSWTEIAAATGTDLGPILAKVQEVSKKMEGETTAKPKRKMKFAPGT